MQKFVKCIFNKLAFSNIKKKMSSKHFAIQHLKQMFTSFISILFTVACLSSCSTPNFTNSVDNVKQEATKIGPDDYSNLPLNKLYDKNWIQTAKDDTPEDRQRMFDQFGFDFPGVKISDIGKGIKFELANGKQEGPIFHSAIVNSYDDDQAFEEYRFNHSSKEVPNPTDENKKLVIKGKHYPPNEAQKNYARRVSAVFDDKFHQMYSHYATRDFIQDISSDDVKNEFYGHKGKHYQSLESVARWMMFDQSFYNVYHTPYGVWGKCRLGKDGLTELTQVVLPSLDNPNKFDVFIDYVGDSSRFSPYIVEDALCYEANKKFCLSNGPDLALYADSLRRNSKTVPFKVVLHDIDRPLRAKDNEIVRVSEKFGLTENFLKKLAPERYHRFIVNERNVSKVSSIHPFFRETNRCEELDNKYQDACRYDRNSDDELNYYGTTQEEWFFLSRILRSKAGMLIEDGSKPPKEFNLKNGLALYANFVSTDRKYFGN